MNLPKGHDWFESDTLKKMDGQYNILVWECKICKIHLSITAEKKEYYNSEGLLHREDGPAIEYANGNKAWYLNGKIHRENGPAVEYANGNKAWYLNGKVHRENGPAREFANGDKVWYLNGQKHREDGPAVEHANGDKGWFLYGEEYHVKTIEEFQMQIALE